MKNQKSIFFLLITFGWSWINWFIGLRFLSSGINDETINQFNNYFFAGVYGPFIGAIITTVYFGGFKSVVVLLKKLFIWRIPFYSYLAVVTIPLLFLGSGIVLYVLWIGSLGVFENKVLAIPALLL